MTVHEVEALSFAELKEQRDAVLEALKAQPVDVLATRCAKHLQDAKQRDEKLGEQGKTITALQTGLDAAEKQGEAMTAQIGQLQSQLLTAGEALKAEKDTAARERADLVARATQLTDTLNAQTDRANRLKVEATRYHAAMGLILKAATEAVGATAVQAADAGEE